MSLFTLTFTITSLLLAMINVLLLSLVLANAIPACCAFERRSQEELVTTDVINIIMERSSSAG